MAHASAYRPAIKLALVQQGVVLTLASLLLDFGQTLRACAILALAQWIAIGMILARRPLEPTRVDLVVIRYGFWLLIPIFRILVPIIYRIKGVS